MVNYIYKGFNRINQKAAGDEFILAQFDDKINKLNSLCQ